MRELIIPFDAYALFMLKNEIETYTLALKLLWHEVMRYAGLGVI